MTEYAAPSYRSYKLCDNMELQLFHKEILFHSPYAHITVIFSIFFYQFVSENYFCSQVSICHFILDFLMVFLVRLLGGSSPLGIFCLYVRSKGTETFIYLLFLCSFSKEKASFSSLRTIAF